MYIENVLFHLSELFTYLNKVILLLGQRGSDNRGHTVLECTSCMETMCITWECPSLITTIVHSLCMQAVTYTHMHSKNEGMKHIPAQYDSHGYERGFHSICFKQQYDDHTKTSLKLMIFIVLFSVQSPIRLDLR